MLRILGICREHDLIFCGCIRSVLLVEQDFRKLRTPIRQPGNCWSTVPPVAGRHVQRAAELGQICEAVVQVPIVRTCGECLFVGPYRFPQSLRLERGSAQVLHALLSGRLSSGVMELFP